MSPTLAVSPLSPERACASFSSLILIMMKGPLSCSAASTDAGEFPDGLPVALLGPRRVLDEEVQLVRARVVRLALQDRSVLAEGVPPAPQLLPRLAGLALLFDRVPDPAARELLRQ